MEFPSRRNVHPLADVIWKNDQGRRVENFSTIFCMIDPADIPNRLAKIGRSQADLARALNLDPSSLTKTIRGLRQMKAAEVAKIEAFLEESAHDPQPERNVRRYMGQSQQRGSKIPVYGYAAGGGEERIAVNDGGIVDWIDAPPLWSGAGDLFGVRVIGSSMEPRLFEGELVIAQRNLPPARERDCLIELKDGSALVKTYTRQKEGRVFYRQWNPEKEAHLPALDVKALHAIVWRR
jgi:phage repressor protein C with HTH and peptisase S24 domain